MVIDARTFASLRAAIVRRPPPLLALPAPDGFAPVPTVSSRGADVRFFVTCYLAGLIFFLVMLS